MALNLPFNIKPVNPTANVDERYGNHSTLAEALTATAGTRAIGLTVLIDGEEYWFKNGISDGDLVVKVPPLEGVLILQGNWDASTNTPDISSETTMGFSWIVSVAGSTTLGGITDWKINDLVVKTAVGWAKIDNTDQVISVAGKTGVVTLQAADITDFTSAVNALITGKLNTGGYPGTANDLKSLIDVLTIIIDNEIIARTQQVVDLQADIDAEIANRIAQDEAEVVFRTTADATLQAQVDAHQENIATNEESILELQNQIDTKADKNGNILETFNVANAVSGNNAVNKLQLDNTLLNVTENLQVSDEFYIEDGKLYFNISTFKEPVIVFNGGSQVINLIFEPTYIHPLFVNGKKLEDDGTGYIFTPPKQLEILGTLEIGDKISITYDKFVKDANNILR